MFQKDIHMFKNKEFPCEGFVSEGKATLLYSWAIIYLEIGHCSFHAEILQTDNN